MGIIIKNFAFNGITLPSVYAGINRGRTLSVAGNRLSVMIDYHGSVNAKAKGFDPVYRSVLQIDLAEDELGAIPIHKIIYQKLKELYPDNKNVLENIQQAATPVLLSATRVNNDIIYTGTCDSETVLMTNDGTSVKQTQGIWTLTLKNVSEFVTITTVLYAVESDCFNSTPLKFENVTINLNK